MADVVFGSAVVELKTDSSKLKSEMDKVKSDVQKDVKEIGDRFAKIKMDIDNRAMYMKLSELKQYAIDLNAKLQQQVKMNVDYGDIEKTKVELDQVNSKLQGFSNQAGQTSNSVTGFFGKIGLAIAEVFAVRKIASFIEQSTALAAELMDLRNAFQGSAEDMSLFQKATAGTVSEGNLLKLSNLALTLGINLKDQPKLFLLATDAVKNYGGTVQEKFDSIIRASEGMVRGIAQLGIERGAFNQRVKELADIEGDSITNLDAEIQKRIRLQAIMELSGKTIEDVKNRVKTLNEQIKSIPVIKEEVMSSFGALFTLILSKMPFINDQLEAFNLNVKKLAAGGTVQYEAQNSITPAVKEKFFGDTSKEDRDKLIKQWQDDTAKLKAAQNQFQVNTVILPSGQVIKSQQNSDTENANEQQIATIEARIKVAKDLGDKFIKAGSFSPKVDVGEDKNKGGIDNKNLLAELDAKSELASENKKLDEEVLLNLEKNISELGTEYEKKRGVIEQNYQKEKADAERERDLEIQKQNNKVKASTKDSPADLKVINDDIAKANVVYNEKILAADQKLHDSKIALADSETKEKLAFDQKYLTITQQLEKDKYDQAIRDYSLSVKDYEAYLNKMLELHIKKLQQDNDEIIKFNLEHPAKKDQKTLIDITEQRTIGTTEIKAQTIDYTEKKNDKEIADWKKHNKLLFDISSDTARSIAEVLSSEWGKAWEKMFGKADSVIARLGQALTEKLLNRIMDFGVDSAFTGLIKMLGMSAPVLSGAVGGGLIGGSFNLASGGKFIVPPGFSNDTFKMNVSSGERVSVIPASQVSNNFNNNVDMSEVVKAIKILNANTVDGITRTKKQIIGIEGETKGTDLYWINKKVSKQQTRYSGVA
jgi:hypothetical protein